MFIYVRLIHDSKAFFSIDYKLFGRFMRYKFEQFINALSLIYYKLFDNFICCKFIQFLNTPFPISTILFGSTICLSDIQFANAYDPIYYIPSSKITSSIYAGNTP